LFAGAMFHLSFLCQLEDFSSSLLLSPFHHQTPKWGIEMRNVSIFMQTHGSVDNVDVG
jgi:hypothetical protein